MFIVFTLMRFHLCRSFGVLTCKEEGVRSRILSARVALVALAVVVALLPGLASAQAIIKVNDNVNFRLGILLQGWADWNGQSDANRRRRRLPAEPVPAPSAILPRRPGGEGRHVLLHDGQPEPREVHAGAVGSTTGVKAPGTGFIVQDAFLSWKIDNALNIQGGLILIPLCRNCNSSAVTLLSIDYGTWSFQESASTQSSVGRDTGFQAMG